MARLTLSFLGPFQANFDSSPVKGFESDKVRALLAYLVVEAGQLHRRDALAAIFWPEQPQEVALKNLRHVVYKLRQVFEESDRKDGAASPEYLLVTPQTVQFNPVADFWLDEAQFAGAMAATRAHLHRRLEVCGTCHVRLTDAAELYRGDFLSGFSLTDSAAFDEWLLLKREELHRQALQTLALLADYHEARGDYATALSYTWRQLKLEPWREEAHRQTMRLLWLTGRRSAALVQYETCCRVLDEEFGILPDSETQVLYIAILDTQQAESREQKAAGSNPDTQYAIRNIGQEEPTNNNLPHQLTPFVGRKAELGQIAEVLERPDSRLLTLVGPGGIGKTRLALQAAANHVGAFTEGVYFVPLAAVRSPELIATTIAGCLKLPDGTLSAEDGESPDAQLLNYLADKEMLIVLDNLEHLLDGVDFLVEMLKRAPGVSLMVTSRAHLGFQGEAILPVMGLPFPLETMTASKRDEIDMEGIAQYESVQLFAERATAALEEFALTKENVGVVAAICRLVAGQPLGIELASALVLDYSLGEIASGVRRNLDFLGTTFRDIPEQHRSLRAVFTYSWDLLTPEEQRAFRRLSVFREGWDGEAAAQVDGTHDDKTSSRVLASLVRKSLLRQSERGRYDIHEMLRQYAAEKLDESPQERAEAKTNHAQYYLKIVAAADANLKRRQDESKWLEMLELEHNNLRAALAWAVESKDIELALNLAFAARWFWYLRGYFVEGRNNLASVLRMVDAKGFNGGGQANVDMEELQRIYGRVYYGLGVMQRSQSDYIAAESSLQKSLAIHRRVGNRSDLSSVLNVLGIVAHDQADYKVAETYYQESLVLAKDLGNRQTEAIYLNNLGIVAREQGNYDDARSLLDQSLVIRRELNDTYGVSLSLLALGLVDWYRGEFASAQLYLKESLEFFRDTGGKLGASDCLEGLARVAASQGQVERAARLWGAADSLREQMGAPLPPADRADYERNVEVARSQLGEQPFKDAWAAGRGMEIEQAISFALQE